MAYSSNHWWWSLLLLAAVMLVGVASSPEEEDSHAPPNATTSAATTSAATSSEEDEFHAPNAPRRVDFSSGVPQAIADLAVDYVKTHEKGQNVTVTGMRCQVVSGVFWHLNLDVDDKKCALHYYQPVSMESRFVPGGQDGCILCCDEDNYEEE